MKKSLQLAASPLSLESLDALDGVDLVAFVAEDERPLQGLAGFIDWRLCGELSRQIKAGRFAGRIGESLLTVSAGRLQVQRIFLFGIGKAAAVRGGGPGAHARDALQVVARAGGRRIATAFSTAGSGSGEAHPANALAHAFVDAAFGAGLEELVLLHPDARAADRALAVAAETFVGVRLADAAG